MVFQFLTDMQRDVFYLSWGTHSAGSHEQPQLRMLAVLGQESTN